MTTTINIQHEEYTAVATAGEGPGLITVATKEGVFFRVADSKPGDADPGHFVAENENIELTKALATGVSLWVRSASKWDGLVVKTLDSEV